MLKANKLLLTFVGALFAINTFANNGNNIISISVDNTKDIYHLHETQNASFAVGNYHEIDSTQAFVFLGAHVNNLVLNYSVIDPKTNQYMGLKIPIGVYDKGYGVACIGDVYHVGAVTLDVSCETSVVSGTKHYYVNYTIVSNSHNC